MRFVSGRSEVAGEPAALRSWYYLTRVEFAVVMGLLLLTGQTLIQSYAAGYRHRHTCVICRLERTDWHWLDWPPTSTYNETKCSKWYSSHVEPSHTDLWSPSSAFVLLNFYGQVIGVGDNEGRPGRAIWLLTEAEQIEIYQHFPNAFNAKSLFVSFTDLAVMQSRRDFGIVYSLRQWIDSGFAGHWDQPND